MSIQVRNLTHIYNKDLPDEQTALEDVSFDIFDGDIVGIVGHTGSGKSTLLQHLNGLLKPTSGSIIIDGKEITAPKTPMTEIRKRVGLVFQYPEYQLFEETVAKDVAYGPKNLGLSEGEIEERVREALTLVSLDPDEYWNRSPFDLSGGQKRRVAIAGVIAMKPHVLVLDEPTAGLDPAAHKEIMALVRRVHDSQNNITILVSHDMDDVARLCDKMMVMNGGHLVAMGSPAEVFGQRTIIRESGLSVPPVTKLLYKLKDRGASVDVNAYSFEAVRDSILDYIRAAGESGGEEK